MTVFEEPILAIPEDAGARLRESLGLAPDEPARLAYLPGPGDVYGTFRHWREGRHDPRSPTVTYSLQFYEFCETASCEGLLISYSAEGAPTIADGGYTFVNIAHTPGAGTASYYASRYQYAQSCLKALNAFKPHATILSSDFDWQYLAQAKRAAGRLILSIHNTRWPMGAEHLSLRQKLGNAGYRLALRSADAAVCTSHECERQTKQLSGDDFPTFVETPQLAIRKTAGQGPRPAPSPTGGRLMFLGRLEQSKGVFDLLEAYSRLRANRPDLELVYAGGGGALAPLREAIAEKKLDGQVRALGQLGSDEVHAELAKADLVVCPTRTDFKEGLALVCFEAAAHGAPSVMSSVVPAQDLLQGACVVYPANDAAALAHAIGETLSDPERYERLSALCRKRAKITFDRSRSWGAQLYKALVAAGWKQPQ
ncbi:glycosyltransferase family 4 protein [Hyphococcus luteus]|nr:glycosyltransferase family 4 protein [Marinicaulis flavus]